MSGALAYHDGGFVDESEVAVGPWDAGLTRGDGLFETLLAVDRRAVDVDAHLDRLEAGLGTVGIELPESRQALAEIVHRVAASAPAPQARLRITVTRGAPGGHPTRIVAARRHVPLSDDARARGVEVTVIADRPVAAAGVLRGLKSVSYQAHVLAHRSARSRGAYEALLVNERGRLVEGTRSNVVVQCADTLLTPPLVDGCLPGTVRRRLLEAGLVREAAIGLDELARAPAMMLTGSLLGVAPVCAVDGRRLDPGSAWKRLYDAWSRLW